MEQAYAFINRAKVFVYSFSITVLLAILESLEFARYLLSVQNSLICYYFLGLVYIAGWDANDIPNHTKIILQHNTPVMINMTHFFNFFFFLLKQEAAINIQSTYQNDLTINSQNKFTKSLVITKQIILIIFSSTLRSTQLCRSSEAVPSFSLSQFVLSTIFSIFSL